MTRETSGAFMQSRRANLADAVRRGSAVGKGRNARVEDHEPGHFRWRRLTRVSGCDRFHSFEAFIADAPIT
jgi:hypothetical protein